MKKLIMLFMLAFAMQGFAQDNNYLNTGTLINASNNDSAFVASTTTGLTGVRVFRSSTSQDSINTRWVYIEGINADITVEFRKVNVSGTDTVQVNFEAFRGHGTPDSSGISRHQLVISNANLTSTYHVSDSTWVSKRLFDKFRISLYERAAQQNDYIINVNTYSPTNSSAVVKDN